MFLPVSLDEAIAWLDKNEVKGVTSRELLRLGYAGLFQICLPLSESAYSSLKNYEIYQNHIDAGYDIDIQKIHDASYVELYGLYVLPPRTLFELEANGKAITSVVFSLDNATPFGIYKDITIDALRVTYQALKILISGIASGAIKESINITEMWLAEAQNQGKIYMEAWRKAGYDPTIANIGLYVEGYFSDKQIYNSRKEVIDRATIVREALTGITGRKKGYKLRLPKIPDGKAGQLPQK